MQRITAAPVAAPVDTFAAPEVRMQPVNTGALQVIEALKGFNDQLNVFSQVRARHQDAAAGMEAAKVQNERMFKNMADLKKAVEAGELPQTSNPYFLLHMKKLAAHEQARIMGDDLLQSAGSDNIWTKDSQAAQQWVDGKLQGTTEGMDNWSGGFLATELTSVRDKFLQSHSMQLAQAREANALDLTGVNVRRAVGLVESAYTQGNPDGISSAVQSLQTFVDNSAAAGVRNADLRTLVVREVLSHAESLGDTSNVQSILDGIKIGETRASDGLSPDAIKDIQQKIDEQEERDFYRGERRDELARKKQARTVLSGYLQARDAAVQSGKAPPRPEDYVVQFGDLDPEERLRIESIMAVSVARYGTEASKAVMADAAHTIADGKWGSDSLADFTFRLVASAGVSAEDAAGSLYRLHQAMDGTDDSTKFDPSGYAEVLSKITQPTVNPQEVVSLASTMLEEKRLSRGDAKDLIFRAFMANNSPQDFSHAAMAREIGGTKDDLETALMGVEGMYESAWGSGGQEVYSLTREGQTALNHALEDFSRGWWAWKEAHPQASPGEITTYLEGLRENALRTYGKTTPQAMQKMVEQKRIDAPIQSAIASNDTGKIGSSVQWADGKLLSRADGSPVSSMSFFQNAKSIKQSAPAVMHALGIESEKDKHDFLMDQRQYLTPDGKDEVREIIERDVLGADYEPIQEARRTTASFIKQQEKDYDWWATRYFYMDQRYGLSQKLGKNASGWVPLPTLQQALYGPWNIPTIGALQDMRARITANRQALIRLERGDVSALNEQLAEFDLGEAHPTTSWKESRDWKETQDKNAK